jgi:hypothetical protein
MKNNLFVLFYRYEFQDTCIGIIAASFDLKQLETKMEWIRNNDPCLGLNSGVELEIQEYVQFLEEGDEAAGYCSSL